MQVEKNRVIRVLGMLTLTFVLATAAQMPLAAQETPTETQSFQQMLVDAGLVTPINMTQTATEGDAAVTLDWVYVDPLRITLQLTTENIDPSVLTVSLNRTIQLTDGQGNVFSYQSLQMNPPVEGDTRTTLVINYYASAFNPETSVYTEDYFADFADSSVNLSFNAQFGGFPLEAWEIAVLPADTTLRAGDTLPLEGSFVFDFTAPVQPARTFDINEQVNAADLDVTLNTVMLTPTQVSAGMCVEMPDGSDWQPQVSLEVDGVPSRPMGWGLSSLPTEQDTSRCYDMTFDTFIPPNATGLVLRVDSLDQGMSEGGSDWEQLQPLMADLGYEFDVVVEQGANGGGGLRLEPASIYQQPGFEDALREARLQAGMIYEGPWVFNVDIGE